MFKDRGCVACGGYAPEDRQVCSRCEGDKKITKMRLIPNWQEKNLRCHFCGETKSVKYEVEIVDPVISSEPVFVCACNQCALKYGARKED